MHKHTLLEVPNSTPVFATDKAASIISSWKHFITVNTIPRFETDWRISSISPLPKWLGISRVAKPGADMLYYHSAIMITFPSEAEGELKKADSILYTPHGVSPQDTSPILNSEPAIKTLALLHGLSDISISSSLFFKKAQLNKGAHNGLKVLRLLRARYWVGTHDEVKKGGGIVSWFLQRKVLSLDEAVEREKAESGERGGEVEDVRFKEVGNGEVLLLE